MLSLRRKNLGDLGEQAKNESTLLGQIELAEKQLQESKVKLESKLKQERRSLQMQMQQLENQLIMAKKNRNERVEVAKEQLAAVQVRKEGVKAQLDSQLHEQQTFLKQLLTNLAELRSIEGSQTEMGQFIKAFVTGSGNSVQPALPEQLLAQLSVGQAWSQSSSAGTPRKTSSQKK